MTTSRIVLASASPRRRELLTQIGISFVSMTVSADETPWSGELPEDYVRRVAADKSRLGQMSSGGGLPVLGADTEVVLEGEICGKPRDFDHARAMLLKLSGREHEVLSAVSLRFRTGHRQAVSRSRVKFRHLSEIEIAAYWDTGEPFDKAGAYAIQGLGAIFVERLSGSYSGVMGLPLFETAELLRGMGIDVMPTLNPVRRDSA